MRKAIRDKHESIAKAVGIGDDNAAKAPTRQYGEGASRSLASLLASAWITAVTTSI